MKLTNLGSNQNEVTIGSTKILFSYNTPVAALNLTPEFHAAHGAGMIKTSRKWSKTTSRHINTWCGTTDVKEVDQAVLDTLAA